MKTLRRQIVACLSRGLPGPAAQREFAPELAYGRHAGPPAFDARQAAVLVLVYPRAGEWFMPAIVRAPSMKEHAGQIALPGGAVDPGETPAETALREYAEELGGIRRHVEILGPLTPLYVFNSNFQVQPILGLCLSQPTFHPSKEEVAELVEIPAKAILAAENHGSHLIQRRGIAFRAPHLQIGPHQVWGATCMILAEVMAIFRQCSALGGA